MSILTWRRGRGGNCVSSRLRVSCLAGNGNKRMRTVMPLINAIIAIAPVAVVAIVTFPVAGVGVCLAHIAEDANFYPLLGVILAHEHMWWCRGFRQGRHGSAISVPDQDMGMLVIGRITTLWCFALIPGPSSPTKAVPMLASSAKTIAAKTHVVLATIAASTIVVKLVLYVVFTTALACHMGLCI